MRSFRNNNKRPRFRSNGDRSFKRNGESQTFQVNANFQRKSPGKNNHNAPKLIEKYNDLAREALSKGDKILSENYFQHADHFTRVLGEQEDLRKNKISENGMNDAKSQIDKNENKADKVIENEQLNKVQTEVS